MVYGRELNKKPTTFGTTGYTYDNTFVLYDRESESLWYPFGDGAFTAISGKYRGKKIPYLQESCVTPLGEWREKHPNTTVLIGDRSDVIADDVSLSEPRP